MRWPSEKRVRERKEEVERDILAVVIKNFYEEIGTVVQVPEVRLLARSIEKWCSSRNARNSSFHRQLTVSKVESG